MYIENKMDFVKRTWEAFTWHFVWVYTALEFSYILGIILPKHLNGKVIILRNKETT